MVGKVYVFVGNVTPQVLYEKLIQGKIHPRKAAGLAIVHEICKRRFDAKATDWGINGIGRESEACGGPKAASLHQPRQEHYRALIKSWQFHAESHHPSTKRRPPSSADDWIFAIENLSARQMVVAIKSDLARAIDEVKLLRKLLPNGGVLEVAQPSAMQAPTDKSSVVVTALAERSCKRFVDGPLHNPAQLPEMGLRLTKKGDLVSESTGEVILEAVAIDLLRAAAKLR
jgi:hypothetical protein